MVISALLANMCKETVSVGGTGNITLDGAVSGFNTFSDYFADADSIAYWIQDGNDWECGVGTYVSATPALARTEILQKSVSGVITDLPTALDVSTSATVSVRPNALMNMAGYYSADWPTVNPQFEEGVFPPNIVKTIDGKLRGNDDAPFFPGVFQFPYRLTKLGIWITTVDGSATDTRAAIYGALPDGTPGSLIVATGNLSGAATGEIFETVGPILIPAGLCYFSAKTDSSTLKCRGVAVNATGLPITAMRGNDPSYLRVLLSGAYPDPAPTTFAAVENNGCGLPVMAS